MKPMNKSWIASCARVEHRRTICTNFFIFFFILQNNVNNFGISMIRNSNKRFEAIFDTFFVVPSFLSPASSGASSIILVYGCDCRALPIPTI